MIVWIDTKYLYALVECLVYFVFDTDIFRLFLDFRIIIVLDDCIIAWNFKSYTRVFLRIYYNSIFFITKVLNIIHKQQSNLYQNDKERHSLEIAFQKILLNSDC